MWEWRSGRSDLPWGQTAVVVRAALDHVAGLLRKVLPEQRITLSPSQLRYGFYAATLLVARAFPAPPAVVAGRLSGPLQLDLVRCPLRLQFGLPQLPLTLSEFPVE